ncbi:MAG: pyruvate dehydrogenase, partial [Burkholderiales bacterium]|nr:pyruvate dehydrogenase [Burkholderiales bacterium]
TSYSSHGYPMLPMYIDYSLLGFQRVGDLIWAAADSRSRGFLLGATAGRTTLSGEGLQHQDGTSHLVASTVPNCRAYDPCFAYELAVILEDGMRRMLDAREDVFYYVTLMNESYAMPSMPADAREGILRGMHRIRDARQAKVRLLGAGTILNEVLAAAQLLEKDWGVGADVFSVTSFTELRREGMAVSRRARHPGEGRGPMHCWVQTQLPKTGIPIVAASDYVAAVADLIRPWIADPYMALGTDGFGRSDTRAKLRRFFEVDRHSIAAAALSSIGDSRVKDAIARYGIDPDASAPWER